MDSEAQKLPVTLTEQLGAISGKDTELVDLSPKYAFEGEPVPETTNTESEATPKSQVTLKGEITPKSEFTRESVTSEKDSAAENDISEEFRKMRDDMRTILLMVNRLYKKIENMDVPSVEVKKEMNQSSEAKVVLSPPVTPTIETKLIKLRDRHLYD